MFLFRRAPLEVKHNDAWECSCALVWDPRHADCAVPQVPMKYVLGGRVNLGSNSTILEAILQKFVSPKLISQRDLLDVLY